MIVNSMQIGGFNFEVKSAFFRYITESWSGPGWDFSFFAVATEKQGQEIFPYGARLRTEAAPLPLQPKADLTGTEFFCALPYDEQSGEPFFGLMIVEEHDVDNLRLKFAERNQTHYLIEIEAQVAETVLSEPASLKLLAWAEQQPDHAYPT